MMIFVIIDCQLIIVGLYDCVCCNYGLLMFNLLSSLLIFHNVSISACCLCNASLMSLLKMLQRIDLNEWRQ